MFQVMEYWLERGLDGFRADAVPYLIEREGTSFTMVKPFREPQDVRELLEADPYYPRVRSEVARALGALDRALREHAKRAA